MGYDRKYGKVTLEKREIPDDEPMLVFRGRDRVLVDVIEAYAELARDAGSPPEHIDFVLQTAKEIRDWQQENPDRVRIPDSHYHFYGEEKS